MLPKISVIIPVYNVENYLHRCVDSVLNQTFQEFEIILINDGSTDKSGGICDDYAQRDSRITVIHKKNARVAAARNDGLKMAKGKYVSFIDSDDWIEPEMFQRMITKADEYQLDFIMCDYKKRSDSYEQNKTQPIRSGFYSKENIVNELYKCLIMFDDIEFPPTISNWVCFFRAEFLKCYNLKYDEDIHYCEDSLFGSKVMYHANNFYYLKDHYYYNYFYNPNSTTNTYNEQKWQSYLKINERLKKYFESTNEFDLSRQIKINMLYFSLNELGQIKYSTNNFEQRINMVKQIMYHPKVKEIFEDFKLPNVSWKTKLIILMIKFKFFRTYNFLIVNQKSLGKTIKSSEVVH
ncbi:glycosyltransferase family 2 protein [Bacillus sp. PS06]|uniref:glycosyltransferase family 2 protein n=1 Tax=Bacillus sp. PS06 TaxID=2764176 RepID=UPI00177BBE3C|nr:glycosyltransferase [Bacillus sp. PS06]MBD8071307.1 glycosyltransferase [Bacillus sp. PS06]